MVAVDVAAGVGEGSGSGRGSRPKSATRLSSTTPIMTQRHKGVMDAREFIVNRSPGREDECDNRRYLKRSAELCGEALSLFS